MRYTNLLNYFGNLKFPRVCCIIRIVGVLYFNSWERKLLIPSHFMGNPPFKILDFALYIWHFVVNLSCFTSQSLQPCTLVDAEVDREQIWPGCSLTSARPSCSRKKGVVKLPSDLHVCKIAGLHLQLICTQILCTLCPLSLIRA